MKSVSKLVILSAVLICTIFSISKTLSYYNTNTITINTFSTKEYVFSLDGNGGSFNDDKVIVKNRSTILPKPIRGGYEFIGFSLNKNGNVNYSINIKDVDEINNKELYAKWEVLNYSISYDLGGGTIAPLDKVDNYTIETDSFTLPKPSRNGYSFVGWTGSNGVVPAINVKIDKGSTNNKNYVANWEVIDYNIFYNLNGGNISFQPTKYNIETSFTLPKPSQVGYTFAGWTGTGLSSPTQNVTVSNGYGDRNYTATWNKNYYTVNYFVNGGLWTQRSTGYNDAVENLNAQGLLDIYHKFHGWTGWVDRMPAYDVNLYANVTESYCQLTTGHGPYGNASALLNVFRSAGWTGTIIEAPTAPGNYMVITDYNLTRAQAETQKNYIASHTNYNNYNYPYLYWLAVTCTNGYSEAWTRSKGQSYFN